MFVKRKRNRSGSATVAVVSKDGGRYSYVKVIGTSSDAGVISDQIEQGRRYVREHTDVGVSEFDFDGTYRLAVTVDDGLVADDAKRDGLKGYVTNAKLADT